MKVAHVIVEHSSIQLDRSFTYRCDEFHVEAGMRVVVSFHHQSLIGFVERVEQWSDEQVAVLPYQLSSIDAVVDEEALFNKELFALGSYMANRYFACKIACYQCMLPPQLKPKSNTKAIKLESWVRFRCMKEHPTKKQLEVLQQMQIHKQMLRSTYYQMYKSVGKRLIDEGYIEVFDKEVEARLSKCQGVPNKYPLTFQQEQAIQKIMTSDCMISLLHGVTGSGKTEVFLQLANIILQEHKQVLILVPEISLTPQMIKHVKSRFGKRVAIYHSALNAQEKYEQYQLVKRHKVDIVVGTRSAIFMPFDQLGFIIMDEEHDPSYKQDRTPCYHCRDIAIWRANYHQCKLVLASATPSLESYARAYKGVYQLVSMPSRINENLPQVQLVQMRDAVKNNENYLLSNAMLDAIYDRLQRKEQVILLLNRRGYTPILRCIACGYVQMCPNCDHAMSYHKEEGVLKCHICDEVMKVANYCPNCHESAWRYLGVGTQRLEESIQTLFPQARIIRMDRDTTTRKHSHENYLRDFGNGKADILIGTQMIAKGLDFENVTLVGILNGDAMLNRSDYRSSELCYDLLEQACGRSGRGRKKGEVIIQAYDTSHYAIQCAANHDYQHFFEQEMKYRHLTKYPPYSYLVSICFAHQDEQIVLQAIQVAMDALQDVEHVKVLGPSHLNKIRLQNRMRILLKGNNEEVVLQYARKVYKQYQDAKGKASLVIDVNPMYLE